ncbi:NAD-dependent epimerase/dehydratase family protein [Sporosarcina cyprini]|uniref:NAD-dependent epimerase/dehydratase family protein n=1 Tax=Sporosarcina cyprini TaxID=2910523 RepID=UPI001EDD3865|nr:NAD-dependent epimerase/dehydratase family protein [Sporosarcina cyprini]MCG3087997.1 NAD-dependent epimerase/dehydratase family protein [Sporosarcina cyprini]
MKVLITGGYGFIGSHVADRFWKEGYEVVIIDNLSTGQRDRVQFRHKGYMLSVEDAACENVFRAFHFDVVVHLAAQTSVGASVENPVADAESNVLGLVNMLTLATKYGVSKFLFASSAAVYGEPVRLPLAEMDSLNPVSPYGMSKWLGETYCMKWNELYGLDTVSFRLSNVYGPRQGNGGEAGVVSHFITNLLMGRTIEIDGDGEQTRDFIYVTDVADAFLRAAHSQLKGVYNLSTNTETTIQSLASKLVFIHGSGEIVYRSAKNGDIKKSRLNNEKVRDDLDWAPLYSLDEGIEKTYAAFSSAEEKGKKKSKSSEDSSRFSIFLRSIKPYVENLLVFLFVTWLYLNGTVSLQQSTDVLIVFYIGLLGILYGKRQAVLASGLSILLILYGRLAQGREFVSLLYDTAFLFQVILYLFIGLVVGYATQRKNNMIAMQKERLGELESQYRQLDEVHLDVLEVKKALQLQLSTREDSFGKVHALLREMDDLEPEMVYVRSVHALQDFMSADHVSFFLLSEDRQFARIVARAGKPEGRQTSSWKVSEHPFLQSLLDDKNSGQFVNKKLDPSAPMMATVLRHNGAVYGVIAVDGISFHHLSLYHENVFRIVTDVAKNSLIRAFSFMDATEKERYHPGTRLLKKQAFDVVLQSKRLAQERNGLPFSLLESTLDQERVAAQTDKMRNLLRQTDYIGEQKEGKVSLLLTNCSDDDVTYVRSRLLREGIETTILGGGM